MPVLRELQMRLSGVRTVVLLLLLAVLQRLEPDAAAQRTVSSNKLVVGAPLSGSFSDLRGGEEKDVQEETLVVTSEGNQAKLHRPGSGTSTPKEDFKPDVSEIAVGGVHQQRRFFGSYAAHDGGPRAAFSGGYAAHCSGRLAVFPLPLLFLVEWRPPYFLPAFEPQGRQWLFLAASMVLCHGSFVVPSGFVPGGGEVLVRELLWTRLRSPLGVLGPLCKI